ncbi:uncharacterized protein LOC142741141 [Rhinoderma darwinii]|uniref:uncharacterized protein LOC142741141 n=1 Tax=Rhinoderma darwinii TaxID=43563 RepID=UPI003F680614
MGTRADLDQFVSILNNNTQNIKLTSKISQTNMDFLDIKMTVQDTGKLSTTIFRKETSVNSLLHASSFHPSHVIRAIPTGQFLRARRVCDSDSNFERESQCLRTRFIQRGYPKKDIEKGYHRACHSNRNNLLTQQKRKNTDDIVRLITPYNSQWMEIRNIVTRFWPILLTDPDLKKHLPPKPQLTAKRSKTLGDHLVRSHYSAPSPKTYLFGSKGPTWGSFSCGHCSICKLIVKTDTFTDSEKKRSFKIVHFINCSTTGVVYMATCPCGLSYVGMTTRELKMRIQEHVRDIKKAGTIEGNNWEEIDKLKSIPRHFRDFHNNKWQDLKVHGIDKILVGSRGGDTFRKLERIECKWITKLKTSAPLGLNEKMSFASFL